MQLLYSKLIVRLFLFVQTHFYHHEDWDNGHKIAGLATGWGEQRHTCANSVTYSTSVRLWLHENESVHLHFVALALDTFDSAKAVFYC